MRAMLEFRRVIVTVSSVSPLNLLLILENNYLTKKPHRLNVANSSDFPGKASFRSPRASDGPDSCPPVAEKPRSRPAYSNIC